MSWSFNIDAAPRGKTVTEHRKTAKSEFDVNVFEPERVILATKCGKVTLSHFIPKEQRWAMLAKGEQPVAWHPWPEHPID